MATSAPTSSSSGSASTTGPGLSPAVMTFVPVLLCAIAVVGFLLFQLVVLAIDRGALHKAHEAQQQAVDNATKLRGSLDALAADTQRLADAGNPNAGLLVAELRKRGITINPNPPAAAASR